MAALAACGRKRLRFDNQSTKPRKYSTLKSSQVRKEESRGRIRHDCRPAFLRLHVSTFFVEIDPLSNLLRSLFVSFPRFLFCCLFPLSSSATSSKFSSVAPISASLSSPPSFVVCPSSVRAGWRSGGRRDLSGGRRGVQPRE